MDGNHGDYRRPIRRGANGSLATSAVTGSPTRAGDAQAAIELDSHSLYAHRSKAAREAIAPGLDRSQQKEGQVLKMKALSLALTLAVCPGLFLSGCNKAAAGAAAASPAGASSPRAARRSGKVDVAALLTKEEVSAILREPVTEVEAPGAQSATYKTAVPQLEASLEVEQQADVADAVQSMEGARKATGFLGGKAEDVPGLGDEAIFGAMSTLYVRKGSTFINVQPPNLQQVAGLKAADKVREAKFGAEKEKALNDLIEVQRTDPLNAGLKDGDDTQGAVAAIRASSKKQGTAYEADARAMAVALAAKVLEKL